MQMRNICLDISGVRSLGLDVSPLDIKSYWSSPKITESRLGADSRGITRNQACSLPAEALFCSFDLIAEALFADADFAGSLTPGLEILVGSLS